MTSGSTHVDSQNRFVAKTQAESSNQQEKGTEAITAIMDDQLGSFKVVKLHDDNFHVWKEHIEWVLAYRELDDHITDEPPDESGEEFKTWKRSDARARAIIGLSLSDEYVNHVRGEKTAKKMWTTILNVFQRHTLLNKLTARRNFYTVSMYDGEKMLNYINRVCQLASTLKSMDAYVDDAEIAMAILNGLPEQYSNLIVALDALGSDQAFTIDFVKSRLLQEEQRSKHRREASTSSVKSGASALLGSAGQNYKSKVRTGASRGIKCEHCGKKGHNALKCWYLHPEKAPWATKTNAAAMDTVKRAESENDKDPVRLMASGVSSDTGINKHIGSLWLIDSGASSHMTFDISNFIKYTLIQPDYVEVGDKSKVLAVGKGTIPLSIIVNGKYTKCLLSNVLHVPDLAYNLLSVSTMDAKGIKTIFSKGQCSMIKNNRVLAQGYQLGGLYALRIAPSDDSMKVAAVASLQLWHARLGHVNCDGIKQMVNKGIVDGITVRQ